MTWGRIDLQRNWSRSTRRSRCKSSRRPREGKDRPGPQAAHGQPVGTGGGEVSRRYARQGQGGQRDDLRGVRKLEEGLEGLVHISEMSWTRRISHPSEAGPAPTTRSRSSSWPSTRTSRRSPWASSRRRKNPGTCGADRYPPGTAITGGVRNMTTTAPLSRSRKPSMACCTSATFLDPQGRPPLEMLEKGQEIECGVWRLIRTAPVALGLKQMTEDPWPTEIPDKYRRARSSRAGDQEHQFRRVRRPGDGLEGLLRRRMADHKVENPEESSRSATRSR